MNDNWQIPRVSIMPASSLSSTLNASSIILPTKIAAKQKPLQQQQQNILEMPTQRSPSTTSSKCLHENFPFEYKNNYRWYFNHDNPSRMDQHQPYNKYNGTMDMFKQNIHVNDVIGKANPDSTITVKRGSKLSQSSNSDGNNSASSIASDSLLLTAANLERFTAIQQKNSQNIKYLPTSYMNYIDPYQLPLYDDNDFDSYFPNQNNTVGRDIFNVNILQNALNVYDDESLTQHELNYSKAPKMATSPTTTTTTRPHQALIKLQSEVHQVIDIERNLNLMKTTTKDLDAASIASSMHFTMINGEAGRNNKDKRKSLCDRGHQVTVLITSMSILFLILILSMVFALEMRARDMLKS